MYSSIGSYLRLQKRLSPERTRRTVSRLEHKRYTQNTKRIDTERAPSRWLGCCGEDLRARRARAASHIGRSVGRSGSLTRTVADPSVDYSGDLTWTWKQVLGIRFSILHTTLINAARLLHRIGTYIRAGRSLGRMRYLVISSNVTCVRRPSPVRSDCRGAFRTLISL